MALWAALKFLGIRETISGFDVIGVVM